MMLRGILYNIHSLSLLLFISSLICLLISTSIYNSIRSRLSSLIRKLPSSKVWSPIHLISQELFKYSWKVIIKTMFWIDWWNAMLNWFFFSFRIFIRKLCFFIRISSISNSNTSQSSIDKDYTNWVKQWFFRVNLNVRFLESMSFILFRWGIFKQMIINRSSIHVWHEPKELKFSAINTLID